VKRRYLGGAILVAVVSSAIFMVVIGRVPAGLQAQQPGPGPGGASNDERFAKVSELISSGLEQGHFNYFYRIGLVLRGNSSWRPGGLA